LLKSEVALVIRTTMGLNQESLPIVEIWPGCRAVKSLFGLLSASATVVLGAFPRVSGSLKPGGGVPDCRTPRKPSSTPLRT
jgi:hypothetical protein